MDQACLWMEWVDSSGDTTGTFAIKNLPNGRLKKIDYKNQAGSGSSLDAVANFARDSEACDGTKEGKGAGNG